TNQDRNVGLVDGAPSFLPNNVADATDAGILRGSFAVAGRWGEPGLIPGALPKWPVATPDLAFNNPVRAGVSPASNPSDGTDDDHDSLDFYPSSSTSSPELGDTYDPPAR